MSKEVYLVDGVRTPIGSFGGSLSPVRADDLAAIVLKALVERHPNLDQTKIEDVILGCANQAGDILGCANQAGEDNRNVARMASLLAGLPQEVAGETVNRLCASGLAAAVNAGRAMKDGAGDLYIAGGVEHMTRGPWVISKTSSAFGRDAQMFDSSFGWRFINPKMEAIYGVDSMGMTAENLAEKFQISREDQDAFACWSQALVVSKDEFSRPSTSMGSLAGLRPAFKKDGTVTAGNASGLNDGAAALLMASEDGLKNHGLTPMVRMVSAAVAGVEPRIMGIGPVEASQKALSRAGLTLDQMDIIEVNEAFAAQVLACTRSLGLDDRDPRINPMGGAISLGHPLGMSGARLLLT
ncbi:MAG: 3-oxoadipyl-CoA thiolase, partial [Bacteroidota bacterium]